MLRSMNLAVIAFLAFLLPVDQMHGQGTQPINAPQAPAGWPAWRGPDMNGAVGKSVPLIDNLSTAKKLWTTTEKQEDNVEPGHGSPVIVGDKVYQTVGGKVPRVTLWCWDLATGKSLWKYASSAQGPAGISTTPCVVGGRVYAVLGEPCCCDAVTGQEIWKYAPSNPEQWARKRERTTHHDSNNSSPAVVGDVMVWTTEAGVIGIDIATGKELWLYKPSGTSNHQSSPVRWETNGKSFVLVNTNEQLTCLDPKTGAVKWTSKPYGLSFATLAIAGDMAVIGTNKLHAFKLAEDKVTELWEANFGGSNGSPVIYNGYIYGNQGDNEVYCARLTDGKLMWKTPQVLIRYVSPIVADGKVFFIDEKQGLLMYAADPALAKPALLGKIDGVGQCNTPALAGGKLVVRMVKGTACFDVGK